MRSLHVAPALSRELLAMNSDQEDDTAAPLLADEVDDSWLDLDFDEFAIESDQPLAELHAYETGPHAIDWSNRTAENRYGDAVDAARASHVVRHASVWVILRNEPRLLAEMLMQRDLRCSLAQSDVLVEPVWRPCSGLSSVVHDFLLQLVVFDVGLPLVRVGATPGRPDFDSSQRYYGDGGYVMTSPRGAEVCYSYGISEEVSFDTDVVHNYGVRVVRQFDMTLGGSYTPPLEEFQFYDEGVAATRDEAERLDSLESHVRRFGDLERRKILQMDVEGAEWEALWAAPAHVLASFDSIVVELHGLCDLRSMRQRAAVLAKLNLFFVVVHVHANNYGVDVPEQRGRIFQNVLGYMVPRFLEVSFVSRRLIPEHVQVVKAHKPFPTPLDYPCNRAPDVLLNVWPWAE